MKYTFISWQDIEDMVDTVIARLPGPYDCLLAITRGGMVPACLMSEKMGLRNIVAAAVVLYTAADESAEEPEFLEFPPDSFLSGKRVLVVDDVWDSGRTVISVKRRIEQAGGIPTVAVLHYKPDRSRFPSESPHVWAKTTSAWIVYPWDPKKAEFRRLASKPEPV